jgi:hypothetical protein
VQGGAAMKEYVAVRLRRGKLTHAVSVGVDSPTETFCGRRASAVVLPSSRVVTCEVCAEWIRR